MNEAQIYETLTGIFHDTFDDESIVLTAATTGADVEGWDSHKYLEVVTAIQMKFGVKFNTGEIEAMKSVGDIVRLIQKKRKA